MPDNKSGINTEKLKEFFKEKGMTQEEIADRLGIPQSLVSRYLNGKTAFGKAAAQTWAEEFGLSPAWLLIGEGEMISKDDIDNIVSEIVNEYVPKVRTFPLIPIEAVAGFGEDGNGIMYADCEQYQVPEFERKGMEFLIRVAGSSMYPKYSNGDILACRKIHEVLFFQWGKTYVIDSSQGQLVKRVFEDPGNPDNIICVSDNKDKYPPFSMPKSDIRSLSLVVGAVKLE